MIKYKGVRKRSFIFLCKIVLIGKFCTALRLTKCSHTLSMLRFCSLTSHKNSSIIYNFWEKGICNLCRRLGSKKDEIFLVFFVLILECAATDKLSQNRSWRYLVGNDRVEVVEELQHTLRRSVFGASIRYLAQ